MSDIKLGAIFSQKDVRDYRIACASNVEFPIEYELEMPEVKNQGNVGSCVAHSISTVIEYFSRLQGDENGEMSVGYIYGNRTNTDHKGWGMVVRKALEATCEYGDVTKASFPYNEEVPNIISKFEASVCTLIAKGYPHRFSSYYRCRTETDIKTALMKKSPVIMAMKWYADIKVVDGVINTACGSQYNGGHCMVIYGWNEQGWKIQNSWGAEWGNNGRAILPYNVPLSEAWGVIDEISETQTKCKIAELEKANNELQDCVDSKILHIVEAQEEIEKKTAEIKRLKNELTEIKKPFNTKIGKIFAMVLNLFFKFFAKAE